VSARAEVVVEDGKYEDSFVGTGLTNLQVLGEEPSSRQVALEDWGSLVVDERSVERSGPRGARVYKGSVNALAVRLTAAHGGLPAGSEILIGHAGTSGEPASEAEPSAEGDESAAQPPLPFIPIPDSLLPTLDGGPYLFPVFGDVSYGDTYGDPRPDVTYHHGNDIFGELGQPLVAVADGTVFAVGWNKVGGNRLWLRDHEGNVFYYAHLSAFSALVTNGARVRAGQVVGFMGHTGDAEAAPPHLHFEVHPVSLLYLGYDGAVDPSAYIDDWRRLERLPFPVPAGWAPNVPGASDAPQPGAVLLGVSDISSAAGLDPDSLRRALESRPRP
jgi:murein DD-endopeptidase MepM/ murein hydrolase activator NlpD